MICALAFLFCVADSAATEIVQWGDSSRSGSFPGPTNAPAGLTNAVALAGGFYHSLALTQDGRVVAWGNNQSGQTNVPPNLTNVVAITAGGYHNLALTDEGRVIAWGWNSGGQANVPPGLSNVVQVAAGEDCSVALREDGSVVAWGIFRSGTNDPTLVPPELTNCVHVAAGAGHISGVTADGGVITWGRPTITNTPTQATNVILVTAGRDASIALTPQGRILVWPDIPELTNRVPSLTNVLQISMTRLWCIALDKNGRVTSWGAVPVDYGHTNTPSGLTNIVLVAAGRYHGLALIDNEHPELAWSMLAATITTNGAALEIPSQRGRLYIVERSDDLSATGWTVHKRLAGNGSVHRIPMATNVANTFYRVRRLP